MTKEQLLDSARMEGITVLGMYENCIIVKQCDGVSVLRWKAFLELQCSDIKFFIFQRLDYTKNTPFYKTGPIS